MCTPNTCAAYQELWLSNNETWQRLNSFREARVCVATDNWFFGSPPDPRFVSETGKHEDHYSVHHSHGEGFLLGEFQNFFLKWTANMKWVKPLDLHPGISEWPSYPSLNVDMIT